jgi:hypothetical protein
VRVQTPEDHQGELSVIMTSKLKVDKAIPSVRTGKPLTAETVDRAIARGRRERDRDNLGGHLRTPSNVTKRSKGGKANVTARTP